MHRSSPRSRSTQSGFGLVEVVAALGIAAFCLVALIGLFSAGLKIESDTSAELQATNVLQSILATRRAIPEADLSSSKFPLPPLETGVNVPQTLVFLDSTGRTVGSAADPAARYALLYSIGAPGSNDLTPFRVHLAMFWPAAAFSSSNLQKAKANASGHLEQLTFLPPR